MKLSIVILNYNVRYFLELCLKSVQQAIITIDAEIIVVDNHSEDKSCEMVRQLFPEVILIENHENYGFSKGNNIGVAKAKGEYICILNPDTVVSEDTFIKLLEFSSSKDKLGIVGCKLINGSGEFLPESKRNIPYVKASLLKLLGNPKLYYASHLNKDESAKVDILVGAFMFLKCELYNVVGGFDEDYFMYGEDIDLSYRILKSGFQNYYYGETTVIHFKGESTLRDKHYAKRFFGAMQIFYMKHFKKNILFNMFVWLGIRLAYLTRKIPVIKRKNIFRYVFISNKVNKSLKLILAKEVVLSSNLEDIKNNDEIIFDANLLSYKSIIGFIEDKSAVKSLTYKILPNNSNFIIGSDNVISRGEIIVFE
ncbi:glycosyltransferase family 2 protein [Confluentibacter flavum]|uniref:Glycosyl transferase family 2 n=1 Tax=Confluentibacter flavum TaxID=1909700 RepID=A0A2N3HPR2_9FLAO|nr:glycosyltransferase family 2 protein [Confluentibacter flavum]PKQ46950.1 glycosyl transferase family 2 [Confluentibacter flavum]